MGPLPDADSVIRVTLTYTFGTDADVTTRLFFEYGGTAPTVAQLNTFCATVAAAWATQMSSKTCDQCTLISVEAVDLTSPTSAAGIATVSHAGTSGGWEGSLATTVLLNFTIARRYRGGRPRVYIPPPDATALNSPSAWTASFLSGMASNWANFVGDIIAAVWTGGGTLAQVNVSYFKGFEAFETPSGRYKNIPTPRATPVIDTILGTSVNAKPANQRRRLGKR